MVKTLDASTEEGKNLFITEYPNFMFRLIKRLIKLQQYTKEYHKIYIELSSFCFLRTQYRKTHPLYIQQRSEAPRITAVLPCWQGRLQLVQKYTVELNVGSVLIETWKLPPLA